MVGELAEAVRGDPEVVAEARAVELVVAVGDPAAVDRAAVLARGCLLGVFLAVPALMLLPIKAQLELRRREWCGFPQAALAELHLRAMRLRKAHPREAPARQAKAEVVAARGFLPEAL